MVQSARPHITNAQYDLSHHMLAGVKRHCKIIRMVVLDALGCGIAARKERRINTPAARKPAHGRESVELP